MKRYILIALSALFAATGCSFLEPFPDGSYNEDNYADYPTIIRGFIDKAYNLRPSTYYSNEFIGTDACTDDMMYRDKSAAVRQFSIGNAHMGSNPLSSVWTRDYEAIYYVNLFLKDDVGRKTRYLVDPGSNAVLQKCLQGDAFGLRAWYGFNLLQFWGGEGTDGRMLGVCIPKEPVDLSNYDGASLVRPTYEESVEQILADCDSALKYLPPANRDQYLQGEAFHVTGAIRYRALDAVSVKALKARVLLTWASPAFNPTGDKARWERAARAAKEVMDFKLTGEDGGLDPRASFLWTDPNAAEVIYTGNIGQNSTFETNFYPLGFGGSANIVPSQELVDAFPMANGYPITERLRVRPEQAVRGPRPPFLRLRLLRRQPGDTQPVAVRADVHLRDLRRRQGRSRRAQDIAIRLLRQEIRLAGLEPQRRHGADGPAQHFLLPLGAYVPDVRGGRQPGRGAAYGHRRTHRP